MRQVLPSAMRSSGTRDPSGLVWCLYRKRVRAIALAEEPTRPPLDTPRNARGDRGQVCARARRAPARRKPSASRDRGEARLARPSAVRARDWEHQSSVNCLLLATTRNRLPKARSEVRLGDLYEPL